MKLTGLGQIPLRHCIDAIIEGTEEYSPFETSDATDAVG